MLKSILIAFAFLASSGSCSLAGDTDTSQWMYPVWQWTPPERRHIPSRDALPEIKRAQMLVPEVTLRGATLAEAVAFLRQASVTADTTSHEGIQFHLADGLSESRAKIRITLFLSRLPLSAAARYVALSSGCRLIETETDFVFVAQ